MNLNGDVKTMNARILATAGLAALAATGAGAQGTSPRCPPGTAGAFGIPDQQRATQDACQLAVDLFQYMAPQLGLALTGGNATLGQGGTLGGLGHFTVGVRANVFRGDLPQVQEVTLSTSGAQRRTVGTEGRILGMPTVDAAIGLFKGIPLGVTNVGGIDLLVSAAYIPEVDTDAVDVTTDNPLKFGFGARLGLVQESLIAPGVSVTFLRRQLPTVNVVGAAEVGPGATQADTLYVNSTRIFSNAWRVVASKNFLVFGLAAGIGQDDYSSSTNVRAAVQPRPPATLQTQRADVTLEQDLKRTNMFLDVSLNLPFTKLVLEVGQVMGGEVPATYNTFSGKAADASRVYGSVGLRFGF